MTHSVSVMSDRLAILLRDVLRAASTDATLAMIAGIQLYTADGRLVASATDRFFALHGHAPTLGGDLPVVWLTTVQVRQILTVLRPFTSRRRAGTSEVTITVADGTVTVRQEGLEELGGIGLTFPHTPGSGFPDLPKLLGHAVAAPPSDDLWMVDPARLVVVAQIAKTRRESMRVQSRGALRPVIIQIGTDLLGIVMPQRAGSEQEAALPVAVYAPPVLDESAA